MTRARLESQLDLSLILRHDATVRQIEIMIGVGRVRLVVRHVNGEFRCGTQLHNGTSGHCQLEVCITGDYPILIRHQIQVSGDYGIDLK